MAVKDQDGFTVWAGLSAEHPGDSAVCSICLGKTPVCAQKQAGGQKNGCKAAKPATSPESTDATERATGAGDTSATRPATDIK